jgi:hypothetical protein
MDASDASFFGYLRMLRDRYARLKGCSTRLIHAINEKMPNA